MKQNNKILLRSTNYLRNTIADSAGASVMAGFDYRQYAAELPGRPRTAPIRRKKRMAKDVPYAHLRKRTSRILFGRSNDSISVRQGRRNIMFNGSRVHGEAKQSRDKQSRLVQRYGSGNDLDAFIASFQENGFEEGIGHIGKITSKETGAVTNFESQIKQVLAYDLTNQKSREKFALQNIKIAGRSKRRQTLKKPQPGEQRITEQPIAASSNVMEILMEYRLKQWTETTEQQFQEFLKNLTGTLSVRTKNSLALFLQYHRYNKMKAYKAQRRREERENEERTTKKLFSHFEKTNKKSVSTTDLLKHSLVKQKWSSVKRKSHVMKDARSQRNDLISLVKADRQYISKALGENRAMSEWLDKKAEYVQAIVAQTRQRAATKIQAQVRRWLALRHAAAAAIQAVVKKFVEALKRKSSISAMVEHAGTKNKRYDFGRPKRRSRSYKRPYSETYERDKVNIARLQEQMGRGALGGLETYVASAICEDAEAYLERVKRLRSAYLRKHIKRQNKLIVRRAKEASEKQALQRRIQAFRKATAESVVHLKALDAKGWDYRKTLQSCRESRAALGLRSPLRTPAGSRARLSPVPQTQQPALATVKSSNNQVGLPKRKKKGILSGNHVSTMQITRIVRRLPELHIRYKHNVCTGENADANAEKTISQLLQKESWAASILQKVMRGHLDRCYVKALTWMNAPANLSKVYMYFDVNRDGDLSRGEIGNLVYQILSERFDPYKKHAHMLKGNFDVARFVEWWKEAQWSVRTVLQKLRFVHVVRGLERFSAASEKAAASLKLIAKGEVLGSRTPPAALSAAAEGAAKSPELKTVTNLFVEVMDQLRSILRTDRGTLFLVDYKEKTLWSAIISQKDNGLKIKVPWTAGIIGYVRQTKRCINVEDAYKCNFFNQSVDRETGYRTKSVLCGVVRHPMNRKVVAVVQLINKVEKGLIHRFSKQDEKIFLKFMRRLEDALKGTLPPL